MSKRERATICLGTLGDVWGNRMLPMDLAVEILRVFHEFFDGLVCSLCGRKMTAVLHDGTGKRSALREQGGWNICDACSEKRDGSEPEPGGIAISIESEEPENG